MHILYASTAIEIQIIKTAHLFENMDHNQKKVLDKVYFLCLRAELSALIFVFKFLHFFLNFCNHGSPSKLFFVSLTFDLCYLVNSKENVKNISSFACYICFTDNHFLTSSSQLPNFSKAYALNSCFIHSSAF